MIRKLVEKTYLKKPEDYPQKHKYRQKSHDLKGTTATDDANLVEWKSSDNVCKRLQTQSLDLVEILYSDAVTKAVLSVWELLLEWRLDSNSKLTIELISSAEIKGR